MDSGKITPNALLTSNHKKLGINSHLGEVVVYEGNMGDGKTGALVLSLDPFNYKNKTHPGSYEIVAIKPWGDNRRLIENIPDDPRTVIASRSSKGREIYLTGANPIKEPADLTQVYETKILPAFSRSKVVLVGSEIELMTDELYPWFIEIYARHRENMATKLEGLDKNFRGEIFPLDGYRFTMRNFRDFATQVERNNISVCEYCSNDAVYSQRLSVVLDQHGNPIFNERKEPEREPAPWHSILFAIGDESGIKQDQGKIEISDQYVAVCPEHHRVPKKWAADGIRHSAIGAENGIPFSALMGYYAQFKEPATEEEFRFNQDILGATSLEGALGILEPVKYNRFFLGEIVKVLDRLMIEKEIDSRNERIYRTDYTKLETH
jgi:thymidine kinase